jgi:hypothetical protein
MEGKGKFEALKKKQTVEEMSLVRKWQVKIKNNIYLSKRHVNEWNFNEYLNHN